MTRHDHQTDEFFMQRALDLAVEINERFGKELRQVFLENGLKDVEVLQDVLGKDRIVKGVLSS